LAVASTASSSRAGKKIRLLGIAVVIIVILYSAGWFFVASKFEAFVGQFVNQVHAGRPRLTCDKLDASDIGNLFRFSLGLSCDKIAINDGVSGSTLTAGSFQALARIYNPGRVNIDLQGPATVTLGDGTTIDGQWQRLQSSLRASLTGLSELSLEGDLPSIQLDSPNLQVPFDLKMREGEFHARQNNGDLDVALIANDFDWKDASGNTILPRLSTSADLTMVGKAGVLEGQPLVLNGSKGELRSFKIETPDGLYGEMSGPFTIDDKGYLNGKFRTTFEKIGLWEQTVKTVFPDAGDSISGVAVLLKGLAKGKDRVTVNLKVDRGNITLSFLPLGRIPHF
jgi:hypothetical protein